MSSKPIDGIKACAFDAYGTLFDVHSAVGRYRERLGPQAEAISGLWRRKQLEYTWLRSLMRCHADFWQVTADALAYALTDAGIDDDGLQDKLMQAYLELDAYDEVSETLEVLRQRGLPLAILSNGAPAMLQAAVDNAGLAPLFDHILSVEACGVFKPDASTYQMANEAFGLTSEEICFLSSNAWDVAGAATYGFQVVWINRFDQPRERLPGSPRAEISRLDQLLSLLETS